MEFLLSQSPKTGQVYFNIWLPKSMENSLLGVSIPSNGSSLFQWIWLHWVGFRLLILSQSPQTGQVYFNKSRDLDRPVDVESLNPLKRVKFISMIRCYASTDPTEEPGLNPLKRVKFISIQEFAQWSLIMLPIFVSIPSNGSSLFQSITSPASLEIFRFVWSQSPQTGQVYFNVTHVPSEYGNYLWAVSIPSNGSSLFQFYSHLCHHLSSQVGSQSPQTGQVYFNTTKFSSKDKV